jgi:hypothetical protein
MRRTAALRALAVVVFASTTVFACSDGAPARAPTWTPIPVDPSSIAPAELAAPTAERQFNIPSDPRISAQVVESMLPTPEAASATLGLAPGAWVLEAGIGGLEDFDFFDAARAGLTAGWTARFEPGARLSLSFFFHGTPEDADRTYQIMRDTLNSFLHATDLVGASIPLEGEAIADAASMVSLAPADARDGPAATTIVIRKGTVTAMVGMTHGADQDVSAGLRDFARMLVLGMDEFIRSQGQ